MNEESKEEKKCQKNTPKLCIVIAFIIATGVDIAYFVMYPDAFITADHKYAGYIDIT